MRLLLLIIIACVLAIDGHPYYQQSVNQVEQNKTAANTGKQAKDSEKQKSDSVSAVSHEPSTTEPNGGKRGGQRDANERIHRVEVISQPTDWVAIVSAVITGMALFASWAAIAIVWKQTKDAKEASERQLRAYICISGGHIRFVNGVPRGGIEIKNVGQTPAYDVQTWIHTWNEAHPLRVKLPPPPPDFPRSRGIIPAGEHHTMPIPPKHPICPVHMDEVGTANWTIYIYGETTYRDVFGKPRFTKFRLIYGGPEGGREGVLSPDTEGNEAD